MLLDRNRPHAFREQRIAPADANAAIKTACVDAKHRAQTQAGLQAYAVHLAHDKTRVMTIEAWCDAEAYRSDKDFDEGGAAVFRWAATGGVEPTPVDDAGAGVIIIDLFSVWRPLVRPVSAFNIRNGAAFNREPGCISTTVLRGIGVGAIATYARWSSAEAFAAAFTKITGKQAHTAYDVNRAAAAMTFGLIRPDYHVYELIACEGDLS